MSCLPPEMAAIDIMASERRWDDMDERLAQLEPHSPDEWSRLLVALCDHGGTSWISCVLAHGADPSFQDDDGETPLSACMSGGSRRKPAFATFLRLLEAGADPDGICRGGARPLQLAISEDLPEYFCALLRAGADPRLSSPDPGEPNTFDEVRYSGPRFWAKGVLDRWTIEQQATARLEP